MKISFFIGEMGVGGAETVLAQIANHYAENKWDVEIVMLLGNQVAREHFHLDERIKIVNLSNPGKSYFKNSFRWLKNINKHFKSFKPDVAVSFVGRVNAVVLTASLFNKIPIVVSERSDPHNDGRGETMLKYCDWVYKRANAIVFQTSYQKHCFSDGHEKRSHIIPNPINITQVNSSINEDPYLIVTAGRLHPAKNHKMLIRAMSIVKNAFPVAKCKIYGEGGLMSELAQLIKAEGLQDTVFLEGRKDDIGNYIEKAKVFAMSSDFEGLSNALMEAMLMGKICISTNYNGVEDLIEDGKNGVIVPMDDEKAMANAIIGALSSTDGKYDLMRGKAKEKMIQCTPSHIMSRWDNVISALLKK